MNKLLAYSATMLSKKYNLRPCSISAAMPEGDIQYLELEFDVLGPLTKKNIRNILVNIVNDFLNNINSDRELCFYLKNNHLNITEVGIGLFFFDSNHSPLDQPNIGIASIKKTRALDKECF